MTKNTLQDSIILVNDKLKLSEAEQVKRMEKNRKKETLNVISEATKEVRAINKDIKMVNKKLAALQPEQGELVTEHAILRYLERYMGLDLEKIHADILALPSADKTMANNTVITVYPEVDDHFNLAQNERK